MAKFVPTPFTVGVHDLMHRPGEQREKLFDIVLPEQMGEGLVAVQKGAQMHLDVRLESVHEGILATVDVDTEASGECGRCLEPLTEVVQVDIQELFAYSLDEAFDYCVTDDHVDLEQMVRDAVVLALPFQPVCRPECAGLDPETGERRSEGQAQSPGESLDPRWAALQKLASEQDS
jgi:uncharacterized protein